MLRRVWLVLSFISACAAEREPPLDLQADLLRRQGRPADSFALYGRALCAAPEDLSLALRFVDVWYELGATGAILASVERCALPEGVVAFVEGLAAGARGDTAAAEGLLARAESLLGKDRQAEIAYRRGLLAIAANERKRAQVMLGRAAGLSPARVDVRLALAQALMDGGDGTESIAVLRGIMAVLPSPEEIKRARRMLQAAIARSEPVLPEEVERTVRELLAELERGQPSAEALAQSQALAVEVNHPRVFTVAALAALKRGMQNEAVRLLEAAIALSPLDPGPWRVLGSAYYATKRDSDAVKPLREALTRDPFDVEVAMMLAKASASTGEDVMARDTYRTLTLLEPEVADHYLGLARVERRLGKPDAAERAALRGCELSPQSVPLLIELASIDLELTLRASTEAERREARARTEAAIERLLVVAPNHPAAAAILEGLKGS